MLRLPAPFDPLPPLPDVPLPYGSNVHRSRMCLSHGNRTRNRNHFVSEICPFLQLVNTHQQLGFQLRLGQSEQNCSNFDFIVQDLATVTFVRGYLAFPSSDSLSRVTLEVRKTGWTSVVLQNVFSSSARTSLSAVAKPRDLRCLLPGTRC